MFHVCLRRMSILLPHFSKVEGGGRLPLLQACRSGESRVQRNGTSVLPDKEQIFNQQPA